MKKFLLFLVSLLVGVGLFIGIIKFIGWPKIKNAFLVFTGWKGMVIFGLTLLMMIIGNWKWKEILREKEVKISFWALFRPYLAGFAVMFLAPIFLWAGEIFRSYDLREKKQIAFTKAMASVIIDRILEWTVNLGVIFFGALFFLYKISLPPQNLLIIFGGVFLFFLIGISLFYFKAFKKESMAKVFGRFFNSQLDSKLLEIEKEVFNFFKPQKKSMWKVLGLSFFRAAIMYLRAWLLIIFLGKEISALPALSILGFTYLAVIIPIPTALGSHEAVQTFAFNSLGLGISTATAFTMIIRAAELLFALAGVVILFQLGVIFLKDFLFKNNQ
ncbi:MAG: lysylphosphatidylglycerol synthase transmembrane domain-containing protein [Candidatus Paceibacterales bacterium]